MSAKDGIDYKKLEDAIAKGIARGLAQHEMQVARQAIFKRQAEEQTAAQMRAQGHIPTGNPNFDRQRIIDREGCDHTWLRTTTNVTCVHCGAEATAEQTRVTGHNIYTFKRIRGDDMDY